MLTTAVMREIATPTTLIVSLTESDREAPVGVILVGDQETECAERCDAALWASWQEQDEMYALSERGSLGLFKTQNLGDS